MKIQEYLLNFRTLSTFRNHYRETAVCREGPGAAQGRPHAATAGHRHKFVFTLNIASELLKLAFKNKLYRICPKVCFQVGES